MLVRCYIVNKSQAISPHLTGLEVAEDHHHPVLHLSLGDELDQPGDHSPGKNEILRTFNLSTAFHDLVKNISVNLK